MAQLLSISANETEARAAALSALSDGHPIALPTETVYGLAADATRADAVAAIYATKERPQFNPLIAHVADMEMARANARFDPLSEQLAQMFWPGPLTLVLPLLPESRIDPLVLAGLDTVALRMPGGFARDLIGAFGRPLAAPSANSSGRISATEADHVAHDLGDRIPLILDGGPCQIGVESTIVKVEGDKVRILRPGGLSAEAIEQALGVNVLRRSHATAAIEAPGMLASHYAPRSLLLINAQSVPAGETLIKFGVGRIEGEAEAGAVFQLSEGSDTVEAAAHLFSMMQAADRMNPRSIHIAVDFSSSWLPEAITNQSPSSPSIVTDLTSWGANPCRASNLPSARSRSESEISPGTRLTRNTVSLASVPRAAASRIGKRSLSIRISNGCVSGSPKRTLNSIT